MILSTDWTDTLAREHGITTAVLMRADFLSGPCFIWTGQYSFTPTGYSDALLVGNQFDPLATGVPLEISENSFSFTGSDTLQISLGVSDPLPVVLSEAALHATEYKSRRFVMWRAVQFASPELGTPAVWLIERTRLGSMDELEIRRGGGSATFVLTVESHASRISAASQSLWLDQKKIDPNDTSQDFVSSITNGHPTSPFPIGHPNINYGSIP